MGGGEKQGRALPLGVVQKEESQQVRSKVAVLTTLSPGLHDNVGPCETRHAVI